MFMQDMMDDEEGKSDVEPPPKRIRTRTIKKKRNDTPLDSHWWTEYIINPQRDDVDFRNMFRFPYDAFIELKDELLQHEEFHRWLPGRKDHFGVPASPIELMLLGSLFYLGQGCNFTILRSLSLISRECHRQFFHLFIDFCSDKLYDKYVTDYRTDNNLARDAYDFGAAGLPGVLGSLDATHVPLEKCSVCTQVNHKGFKMSVPARTYNITVNHRRYIISTTKGCPAAWNDKSVVKFDNFAMEVKKTNKYDHFSFMMYEKENGIIRKQKYIGGWFITDNGYQPWSIFVPPHKSWDNDDVIDFAEWIESMRKDVECSFGILKKRWRVLKHGFKLEDALQCDKMFLTCCALHNLLILHDGFNKGQQFGDPSLWEGEMPTHFDPDSIPLRSRGSDCLRLNRLHNRGNDSRRRVTPDRTAQHTESEIISPDDAVVITAQTNQRDGSGNYYVKNLTLDFFRQKLVDHFIICKDKGQLHWPKTVRNTP
jgi:hypothetical protein